MTQPIQINGVLHESISQIETHIDDMNPQVFDAVFDRLFEKGALDVAISAVVMKKNRPGQLLIVIAKPEIVETLLKVLFQETTTLGIRVFTGVRYYLAREIQEKDTKWGMVRYKQVMNLDGTEWRPEYDDCKLLAARHGMSVREMMQRLSEFN